MHDSMALIPESPQRIKADRVIIDKRLEQVRELIARGATTAKKVQYFEQAHGLHRRQVQKYIARVRKEFLEHSGESIEYRRNLAIERYTHIYKEAMAAGQLQDAIKAQVRIDRLTGVEL